MMKEVMEKRVVHYGRWVIFLIPIVIFLPGISGFAFIRGATFSDLAVSHFPIAVTIQQSVREFGQIPLWSDSILSGFPLAANPLSSLFYPPHWLALLLPMPFGLNLMAIIHLVFGGVGMYQLMQQEGVGKLASLFGAIAFEAMPKLAAHWASGHLTLIYGVAWTPWLLLAETQSYHGRFFRRVLPGAVLGMIVLADVRWSLPAALLWCAYRFIVCGKLELKTLLNKIGWTFGNVMIALGVAAGLIFPLLEYTRLSTRSLMTAMDVLIYSLPPERFLGLLIPDVGSTPEWVIYPGGLILAAVLFAIRLPSVRRRSVFWLGVVAFGLVFSLGDQLPFMPWIAKLPGFEMVRVPTRMMFLSGFGWSAVLAWTIHLLMVERDWEIKLHRWNPMLFLTALATIVLILGIGVGLASNEFPWRFIWGGISLVAAMIWLGYGIKNPTGRLWVGFGLALIIVDLCGVNVMGLEFRARDRVVDGSAVVQAIQKLTSSSDSRLYSPSYSVPQQTAAWFTFELADGVDPLQLKKYHDYMVQATGVRSQGYSVTIPPYADGEPETSNQKAIPDMNLLGILNVGILTADFDLDAQGLVKERQIGSTRIYRNYLVRPRAWVQAADVPIGEGSLRKVDIVRSPNRWTIQAEGPGLLVISEINYPGWKLRVDDRNEEIVEVGGLFRGVMLEDGLHAVEMVFQPTLVYAGALISFATLVALTAIWARERH